MTKTATKAPFRADHVGSLLRPERLHNARKKFEAGSITAEALYDIETEEIRKIVDKQIEAGLEVVTDGEFRRRFRHTDFQEHLNGIEGYVPEQGYILDRKSTRLNSSHVAISYAVFCLKKKNVITAKRTSSGTLSSTSRARGSSPPIRPGPAGITRSRRS